MPETAINEAVSVKLEPCPHEHEQRALGVSLAGSALLNAPRWFVRCHDCEATGPRAGTPEEAIAAWNHRAAPAPYERMREALRQIEAMGTVEMWAPIVDEHGNSNEKQVTTRLSPEAKIARVALANTEEKRG